MDSLSVSSVFPPPLSLSPSWLILLVFFPINLSLSSVLQFFLLFLFEFLLLSLPQRLDSVTTLSAIAPRWRRRSSFMASIIESGWLVKFAHPSLFFTSGSYMYQFSLVYRFICLWQCIRIRSLQLSLFSLDFRIWLGIYSRVLLVICRFPLVRCSYRIYSWRGLCFVLFYDSMCETFWRKLLLWDQ